MWTRLVNWYGERESLAGTILISDHDYDGCTFVLCLGSLCCVLVLFMCHYAQIRFPGIPVRRCRFSGIGVDGNAFHRLRTCHKSSYLSHLSSKQLFLIDTYRLKKYLSTGWHGSSPNFYIHSLIQFCCLFIRSKSWKHFFANMSNSGMVWWSVIIIVYFVYV